MSDTLQLVVVLRTLNITGTGSHLSTHSGEVECMQDDDKLKRIGHSLRDFCWVEVDVDDDKLKHIGHLLSHFRATSEEHTLCEE